MTTTSMLSRGLYFSPDIRHAFIVGEPRNMVDFLHRTRRSARAGQVGKVVVPWRLKGRAPLKATEMKKVGALRRWHALRYGDILHSMFDIKRQL